MNLGELNQVESFSYWRAANDVGGFKMVLKGDFDSSLVDVDHIIQFWRRARGGREIMLLNGFCRMWGWFEDHKGNDKFFIEGVDQNDLVDRRIVAYAAESAEAKKADQADDMLKEIVDENMGASAPNDEAGRPRGYDSDHFSVQANTTEAPSVTRSFAWRYVLPTLQEICQSSRDLGTPLYFEVVPSSAPAVFEFQTFTDYLGMDRTIDSPSPVVFSKENKNLAMPRWEEDWFEERNYVYGGGQGEEGDRVIDPEDDVWRMHKSIWNRRECFQDAREESTTLGVANKAYERMQRERPVVRFEGDLLDTKHSRFGVDWFYGDQVTASYKGRQFDGMVDGFLIRVDPSGHEEFACRLEVERGFGWE
jgi:hypothetical protein